MAEKKTCQNGNYTNCICSIEPLKYGDYLFRGKKTVTGKQRHRPDIEELKDIFESDDHSIPLDDLLERLGTDLENGLSEDQVISSRERFGLNVVSTQKSSKWRLLRSSLRSTFFFEILGVVSSFALTVIPRPYPKEPLNAYYMYLALTIVIAIMISASVSFWQEQKSVNVMNCFNDIYPLYASVIRDGRKCRIHQKDVVVGDLVLLKAGNHVPADVRVTEAWNLVAGDLPLFCRSDGMLKTPECTSQSSIATQNMVLFGTLCMKGYGQGIAVNTGDRTIYAHMLKKTVVVQKKNTAAYKEVRKVIKTFGAITSFLGIILFAFNVNYLWMIDLSWTSVFVLVIVLISASKPDILYSVITACLASSAEKMAYNNCLPKHYEAVETLGSVSVICCQKTGTITQNRMTLVRLWLDGKIVNVEPSPDRTTMTLDSKPSPETWDAFSRALCLCSTTASKSRRNRCIIKKGCSCDQKEVAIMEFMNHMSEDGSIFTGLVDYTREKFPKLFEIPLNSYNKYHVTIHDTGHSAGRQNCELLLCMKGAIEIILNFCSTVLLHGREEPISFLEDLEFQEAFENLMEYGETIIGFCDYIMPTKQFDHNHVFEDADLPNSGFRFLGFVAILDPPRPSVAGDIKMCKKAGIKVILMTSDHPITGKAIAKQVGIISQNSETRSEVAERFNITPEQVTPGSADAALVTGSELQLMDKEELHRLLKNYREIVFARIESSQKLDIVTSLQRDGQVVAISGDGPEDCLAMTRADVGIGMGMHGCDISRDSSDIILLGDNFASIVAGIKEGRIIYSNIRKATVFVLSSNLPKISPLVFFTIFKMPLPIGPVPILLITMIVETASVVVLAQEKAEKDIMNTDPLSSKELFDYRLLHKTYLQIGVIGSLSGMFSYFMILSQHGFMPKQVIGIKKQWESPAINDLVDSFNQEWTYKSRKNLEFTCHTSFFATIIVLQWFNIYLCRTRRQSAIQCDLKSLYHIAIISLQSLVVAFFIYMSGISTALHLSSLRFAWWFMSLGFGVYLLICEELLRFILRYVMRNSWLDRETF